VRDHQVPAIIKNPAKFITKYIALVVVGAAVLGRQEVAGPSVVPQRPERPAHHATELASD
jgi:hypothetical protein